MKLFHGDIEQIWSPEKLSRTTRTYVSVCPSQFWQRGYQTKNVKSRSEYFIVRSSQDSGQKRHKRLLPETKVFVNLLRSCQFLVRMLVSCLGKNPGKNNTKNLGVRCLRRCRGRFSQALATFDMDPEWWRLGTWMTRCRLPHIWSRPWTFLLFHTQQGDEASHCQKGVPNWSISPFLWSYSGYQRKNLASHFSRELLHRSVC